MRKTLCKNKAETGPLSFLEASCPVEAKAYRELQRKQSACEGRGFTGVKLRNCMGGEWAEAKSSAAEEQASGSESSSAEAGSDSSSSSDNSAAVVREGTKALKGLFGF